MALGLAASMQAMTMMDGVSAATTTMTSEASAQKMRTDAVQGVMAQSVDTVTKGISAMNDAAKKINI